MITDYPGFLYEQDPELFSIILHINKMILKESNKTFGIGESLSSYSVECQ